MAQIIRNLRPAQTKFQKVFAKLCCSHSAWQAWSDFVELTALAISNQFEHRPQIRSQREERYLNIISGYSNTEQELFPELFAILVNALEENPEQDFLGEMFMALELGSHWHGQFFTPYNLCAAMAMLTLPDAEAQIRCKGYAAVNDPACGAGATLIGARNALQKAGYGSSQAFFVGQDIDRTAGMMCYVQLSLLGCAGYVVIANTLSNPLSGPLLAPVLREDQDCWFTPMYYADLWRWRGLRGAVV